MNILRNVIQSRHFKFGLPFIGLLVGASFGLTNVTSHRYEFRKTKGLQKEDIEALREKGILKKPEESLEKLHEEYMQKQYSENYENLRIPRPWEDEGTGLLIFIVKSFDFSLNIKSMYYLFSRFFFQLTKIEDKTKF